MTPPAPHTTPRTGPIRRRARARTILAVAGCGATLLATLSAAPVLADDEVPAGKDVTVIGVATDPDDTFGRFDIVGVQDRVVQLDGHRTWLTYRVRTQSAFVTGRLDADDRNFVLELNRDGEAGSERNVRISARDGVLVAEVISNATRRVIAKVDVSRPSDHTVQITGSRRLIGARSYFWTSNFHAPRAARCAFGAGFPIVCQDSVPQRGWLRLDQPAWPAVLR